MDHCGPLLCLTLFECQAVETRLLSAHATRTEKLKPKQILILMPALCAKSFCSSSQDPDETYPGKNPSAARAPHAARLRLWAKSKFSVQSVFSCL